MFRGRGRHLADRREGDPGRRPRAGQPGRRTFVSGKRRQNTVKTTTISDGHGRTLWSGAQRPGRMHDQTSVRTEGIAEQLYQHPGVSAEVDDGSRGLASESLDQVSAPPKAEGHEGSERRAGHRAVRLA
ncbi:transposase family protein [Streptomyces sp. NPDC127044]